MPSAASPHRRGVRACRCSLPCRRDDLWVHHRRGHADLPAAARVRLRECRGVGGAGRRRHQAGSADSAVGRGCRPRRLQAARPVCDRAGRRADTAPRPSSPRRAARRAGSRPALGRGNIHFIAAAASEQAGGHFKLALLDRQRVFGDGQLFAGMAGRHIAAHDPGYRTDACRLEQRRTGVGCRTGCFGARRSRPNRSS